MQSTNVRQIKAALVDQAFHGTTRVSCLLGPVVAVSRWKGQLRVMVRGWGRWYPVESVRIEGAGIALLQHLPVTRQPPQEVLETALVPAVARSLERAGPHPAAHRERWHGQDGPAH